MKFGLGAAASASVASAPGISLAQSLIGRTAPSQAAMRSVGLDNLHTGESIEAVYWERGQYIPDVLDEVNTHLRDYRTGAVHSIDPRLLDLLDAVSDRTGSRSKFQVISGYRSPQTNALLHEHSAEVAKKSFHIQGMAIDVRLPDVELRHLHAAAVSLGRGGVGFYPESNFVHIDVGPVRAWSGV